ncbi:MAG: hypothetical protein R3224_06645 [Balneolaceae bacterium]|nr:hypothetical protein [Balneolaceae bacterium]
MPRPLRPVCPLIILVCLLSSTALAQGDTKDEIHLFQSFFRDAPITANAYAAGHFNYSNFDFLNTITAGGRVGYAVTPELEVTAGLSYMDLNFDGPGREDGLSDVPVFVRYSFLGEETKLSGGVFGTIPVGGENIGNGNFNFGFFGAVRHPVSDEVVLTGNLGVDFLETAIEDYEASLHLGAGVIYEASENVHVLGELGVQADTDDSSISGGVDYLITDSVHLRGNLLLGTDQGAADFGLTGELLVHF